ncbi:hypothetical protein [Polyangium spumosum]|uniref:Uncharacterized protein n=1 Tax=Polyangium spumosum TaxID=889282 RepID=A0A6N7PWK6_9BACT|nr:hypothetical protein [Polyangium spumosum]MRG93191.1 hypothetical protein [Polyangium spumosum]
MRDGARDRLGREGRQAHPATIVQAKAPHPATVQGKGKGLPPHPATVVQSKERPSEVILRMRAPDPRDSPFMHPEESVARTYRTTKTLGPRGKSIVHERTVAYPEVATLRPLGFRNAKAFVDFMLMLFDEVSGIEDLYFGFTGSSVEGIKYMWAKPDGHKGLWDPNFDGRGPSDYDLALCSKTLFDLIETIVDARILPRSTIKEETHTCPLHEAHFRVIHEYVMEARLQPFQNLINLFVRAQENGPYCTQVRDVNFMVYKDLGALGGHTGRALVYKEHPKLRTIGQSFVIGGEFNPKRTGK